jgi:siroheme synthase-like protein
MTRPAPPTTPGAGPAAWFPVFLDLRHRPVLVVGGGTVAEAKVYQLLDAHADVTVVAPDLGDRLAGWHADGLLRWVPRRFRPDDVDGAFIVVAATDLSEVNRAVWTAAEARQIPVNAADDPDHCSFILPASHRQGDLTVAVSTAGRAPALAVRIRDRMAEELDAAHGPYVDLLGTFREEIKRRFSTFEERRRVWYRIVDDPLPLDLVRHGAHDAAAETVRRIIDDEATATPPRRFVPVPLEGALVTGARP